jgi:hypothetical protein
MTMTDKVARELGEPLRGVPYSRARPRGNVLDSVKEFYNN